MKCWTLVTLFYLTCARRSLGISSDLEAVLQEMCPGYHPCRHDNTTGVLQPSKNFVTTQKDDKNTCCFPCSCDSSLCHLRNTCCPSALLSDDQNETQAAVNAASSNKRVENNSHLTDKEHLETVCVPTFINVDRKHVDVNETKNWNIRHVNLGVFMVTQCPSDINDTRCTSPDLNNIEETIPQTDTLGITYRNIFCARCNLASSLAPWKLYVTCSSLNIYKADDLLFPNTVEKMYRYAVLSDLPTCGVDFMPPENVTMTSEVCLANENVISECNDTKANQSIIESCRDVKIPFVDSDADGVVIYANVFCFLCTLRPVHEPSCPVSIGLSYYNENTFVAELNIGKDNDSSVLSPWFHTDMTPTRYVPAHVDCANNTVFDPYTRECREWFCPSGRMVSGRDCIPILSAIDKATYRVDLRLEPDFLSILTYNATNGTEIAFSTINAMMANSSAIQIELVILAEEPAVPYLYAMFLLKVLDPTDHSRSLFDPATYEKEVIIDSAFGQLTMNVSFGIGLKLELSTFLFSNVIVIDMIRFTALRNLFKIDIRELELAIKYPKINRLSFCTQVLLEGDEIRYYVDMVDIRAPDIRLYEGEFLRTVHYETVRVCISDYLRNVDYDMRPKPGVSYSPQAILSFVCNLMSMVGLLITLVTYSLLDELRSVPGKNNMMLSLHLLIAQCLYQFGMDKTEYPTACIVLGILIHMFWLTAIFWMNACTLHMFRTFVTGQSYRSVRAFDPQVFGYAFYCYSVAIFIVSINIGISLYESDAKDFGYGDRHCYISKPAMVGWTFALPVGVIIILNLSFFLAVVYQISASTMRRRGKQTDRANTVIYMKLSSLTGVTWVFGYLYLWTEFEPLEYIFIVLNAGQGVFIFISFICTKRITKLYWALFRKWGRSMRETGVCACSKKSCDSETNVVEMNTAKISLTAGSTSKGVLPSSIARKIMNFHSKKQKSPVSVKGNTDKVSDNSQSDVFKDCAVIAHALSDPTNQTNADIASRHSRRTESGSLSSEYEQSEIDRKPLESVVCHTNVNMLPLS